MIVVADTSPLTALLHLKKLYLLQIIYGEVYIPSAVAVEINSLKAFGFDISFLKQNNIYLVRKAQNEKLLNYLKQHLDEGEAEAIVLAKELKADLLLIDEKLGKQYAEAENIFCKGVVGILIEAKQQGLLNAIKPLLDDLIKNLKFRLSDKIYSAALKKAGE